MFPIQPKPGGLLTWIHSGRCVTRTVAACPGALTVTRTGSRLAWHQFDQPSAYSGVWRSPGAGPMTARIARVARKAGSPVGPASCAVSVIMRSQRGPDTYFTGSGRKTVPPPPTGLIAANAHCAVPQAAAGADGAGCPSADAADVACVQAETEDYGVIDCDVVMDQDVAEANRLADGAGECGSADTVLAEETDGVTVVCGRSPAFRCADVLGDIGAALDCGDEGVLDAPEPDGILTPGVACRRFALQHRDVVGDAAEQPQDAVFVNHGLPAPGRYGGGELTVSAGDPR